MHVIIYKSCATETSQRFTDQVESVIPEKNREVYTEIEAYLKALKYPLHHRIITVLLIDNTETLLKINATGLLHDIPNVILVTSRENIDNQSLYQDIYPRYLAYTNESFEKVSMVLINMMNHMERNTQNNSISELTVNNNNT